MEALPVPVVESGRKLGWKLRISGKDPAYFELRRVLPVAEFGDPENTEYYGNPDSAGKASVVAKDEAVHTPPKGSPVRNAIMDVMRFDFYKDKEQAKNNSKKILFVVYHLKVMNGWACVSSVSTQNGKEIAEPRWAVLKKVDGEWIDQEYFYKLFPYPSEEAAMNALDMKKGTVDKLLLKLPGCPKEIFR